MFDDTARYYDFIYGSKDYAREAARVREIALARYPNASSLLDVACGTGAHLRHWVDAGMRCEGLDITPGLIDIARERLPDTPLHIGDMLTFALGRTYDVVTCLFSAIGAMRTQPDLDRAVATMAAHVGPGGVLIVEPWLTPDNYREGHVFADVYQRDDRPDLKIARAGTSLREGTIAVIDLHHLIVTPAGVEHALEPLRLGLFTHDQMRAAFAATGLAIEHDEEGLIGRGLWIGTRA